MRCQLVRHLNALHVSAPLADSPRVASSAVGHRHAQRAQPAGPQTSPFADGCYNPNMLIRPYHPQNLPAVAAVYRDAVLSIDSQQYTPKQVKVWASFVNDTHDLAKRLADGLTLVAIVHKQLVAFGQLHPDDHLSLLYTSKRHARKGIATAIHQQLEDHARKSRVSHIDTQASHISRPFFETQGYELIEAETVMRQNVSFERFKMRKQLV